MVMQVVSAAFSSLNISNIKESVKKVRKTKSRRREYEKIVIDTNKEVKYRQCISHDWTTREAVHALHIALKQVNLQKRITALHDHSSFCLYTSKYLTGPLYVWSRSMGIQLFYAWLLSRTTPGLLNLQFLPSTPSLEDEISWQGKWIWIAAEINQPMEAGWQPLAKYFRGTVH